MYGVCSYVNWTRTHAGYFITFNIVFFDNI